jgi:deoxyribodipyrimidine photo-lyase
VSDRLSELGKDLAAKGLEIVQVRRAEDAAVWPRSTKGFFGLKERIPELIRELGIGVSPHGQGDGVPSAARVGDM